MSEALEIHEKSEHAAHAGRKHTALLIALLAAGLAFCEQGAQHAGTQMSEQAVAAADTWAQYQAKSIRFNQTRDFADLAALQTEAPPASRAALIARLQADAEHFDNDPHDGRKALAARAQAEEAARIAAHQRLQAFDNAAATLQLAIVLTTASIITGSSMLVVGGVVLGAIGAILGMLGLLHPALASF